MASTAPTDDWLANAFVVGTLIVELAPFTVEQRGDTLADFVARHATSETALRGIVVIVVTALVAHFGAHVAMDVIHAIGAARKRHIRAADADLDAVLDRLLAACDCDACGRARYERAERQAAYERALAHLRPEHDRD